MRPERRGGGKGEGTEGLKKVKEQLRLSYTFHRKVENGNPFTHLQYAFTDHKNVLQK